MEFDNIPFVRAKNYTPVKNGRHVQYLVIHSMEAPEKGETAENVANYFRTTNVKASAHYCFDTNSVVQCVETKDVAWACPGLNHNGIQLELAGYARQTQAEWMDGYSQKMLKLVAEFCGKVLCPKYDIPIVFRNAASLVEGNSNTAVKGFTTHWEATKAFKRRGGHTDPGPGFPMSTFLGWVREYAGEAPPATPSVWLGDRELTKVPVEISRGISTAPVAALAEELGFDVSWDGVKKRITLKLKQES